MKSREARHTTLTLSEHLDRLPLPIRGVLRALTIFQRLGMQYRMRRPVVAVPLRIISYGNITVGGTGKTPAVIRRAQEEIVRGERVGVLTRGYFSKRVREPLVLEPEVPWPTVRDSVGDEAAVIRRHVPHAWIIKSRDRIAGAHKALECGITSLLLDDGFQAVRLARDEDIVVINARDPFGNGYLIPRGILREEKAALRRATALCLTHCDEVEDTAPLREELFALNPDAAVEETVHQPVAIWHPASDELLGVDALKGQNVTALCAIGNPASFQATLEKLGIRVEASRFFRDHATIPPSMFSRASCVVMTEKDAVRLTQAPDNVFAVVIQLARFHREEKVIERNP